MRFLALAGLFGCADLTDGEISALLDHNTAIVAGVESRLDAVETLVTPSSPFRHGQGDGDYVFDGVLSADGSWDAGDVGVTGSGSSREGGSLLYSSLQLDYQDVEIDGATLTGPVDATVQIVIVDGEVEVFYGVIGVIEASGGVKGTADMRWTMTASSVEGGRPVYTGTIDGVDVATVE